MMRIIRDYHHTPEEARGCVLAIGNFDGVHLGHRAVLEATRAQAKALGVPFGVMTFEPHPRRLFVPSLPPMRLFSASEKLRLLKEAGADLVFAQRFDAAFAGLEAEGFIRGVLHAALGVRHVVTGEDFIFGKARGGDRTLLANMAQALGFGAEAVPPVMADGAPCSSTRIRAALADGDIALTRRLLGRDYAIHGRVQHGDARGRTIGFPTANLLPNHLFLPRFGVYAVRARLESGAWRAGVANLGIRPTVGGDAPRLEVHLFDFSGDLYDARLDVHFHQFLRPERHFESLDALKAQIESDSMTARHYFEQEATV